MFPISKRQNLGIFVNKPFTAFLKLDEKVKQLQTKISHRDAMILLETFCNSIKKPNENIDTRFDEERKINIERNRHIVKTIAEAILFCGR